MLDLIFGEETINYLKCCPLHNQIWYTGNFLIMGPISVLWLLTFLTQQNYVELTFGKDEKKKQVKRTWLDPLWIPYFLFAQVYYMYDTYFILQFWNFDLYQLPYCKMAVLGHHFMTFIGGTVLFLPHFPWFILMPLVFHAFLIVFPHQLWLNGPYGVCAAFYFWGLLQKPF